MVCADVSKKSGVWVKTMPGVWLAFVLSCFKIYLLAFSLKNRYFTRQLRVGVYAVLLFCFCCVIYLPKPLLKQYKFLVCVLWTTS